MIALYDQDSINDSIRGGRAHGGSWSGQGCCHPGGHRESFRFMRFIHTVISALFWRRSAPLRVLTELQTQFPRGPEESHFDRPFRGIENLAHALQLKALEMPQVKNQALSRRESL